jgi:hypothetical protein
MNKKIFGFIAVLAIAALATVKKEIFNTPAIYLYKNN